MEDLCLNLKSKQPLFQISERGVRVCLFLPHEYFFPSTLLSTWELRGRHFAKPKHNYLWIVTHQNIQLT